MPRRGFVGGCALGALLAAVLAAGAAHAQMSEDQFFNAVMPTLMKVDLGGSRPLSALWLAPAFWEYEAAVEKEGDLDAALIGRKLMAESLLFALSPAGDKPVPDLKAAAAGAVLRLPGGAVLRPLPLPAMLAKEIAGKNPGDPVMVAFPAKRADGSSVLPTGAGKLRLELRGAGTAKPRVFVWSLPLSYPAAAKREMERAAADHAARLKNLTAPAADLAEKMLPWLLEFRVVGSAWLGVAWCPPEWWELAAETDAEEKAALQTIFGDKTTFMLLSFSSGDQKALEQWAGRCVLIDAAGARHAAVKLPAEFQSKLTEGFTKGAGMADGEVAAYLIAFPVKLDTTTKQPFRILLQDAAGKPAAIFRWQLPLPMPTQFAEALTKARPQ